MDTFTEVIGLPRGRLVDPDRDAFSGADSQEKITDVKELWISISSFFSRNTYPDPNSSDPASRGLECSFLKTSTVLHIYNL